MKAESYMLAIPKNQEELFDVAGMLTRLSKAPGIKLLSHDFDEKLKLTLEIEQKEYRVEIEPMDFEIPEMFRIQHFFPDLDIKAIEEAKVGLSIVMEFGEDALASYHAQLRIIHVLLPNVIAVLDASSEKILSGKWVQLAAASSVPPAPRYIYTVQAVSGEDDCVWLHSHGLNRCGLPEIEVLDSRKTTYQNHYHILETMANRLLEAEEPVQMGEPFFVARVTEQIPLIATLVDWEEAVAHYPDDMLGGRNDREESHNENTCGLFVYSSAENLEKGNYSPVSIFDELLQDNPIYMISQKETQRMKRLSAERLPFMLKASEDKNNKILVKIGLEIDEEFREEENQYEHIWFELLEAGENTVKCRLTQEPYYVKSMHKGSEGTYPFDRITDWLIYTKERRITADDVYLLDMDGRKS